MTNEPLVWGITIVFGLIFGTLTARSSMRREKIHGGVVAIIFNWLASVVMLMVLPLILGSIFIGHNAGYGIVIGLLLIGVCGILLVIFAIFEKAPREAYLKTLIPKEDRGWTAEDALKSGL
jgi:hypothetical protein